MLIDWLKRRKSRKGKNDEDTRIKMLLLLFTRKKKCVSHRSRLGIKKKSRMLTSYVWANKVNKIEMTWSITMHKLLSVLEATININYLIWLFVSFFLHRLFGTSVWLIISKRLLFHQNREECLRSFNDGSSLFYDGLSLFNGGLSLF